MRLIDLKSGDLVFVAPDYKNDLFEASYVDVYLRKRSFERLKIAIVLKKPYCHKKYLKSVYDCMTDLGVFTGFDDDKVYSPLEERDKNTTNVHVDFDIVVFYAVVRHLTDCSRLQVKANM